MTDAPRDPLDIVISSSSSLESSLDPPEGCQMCHSVTPGDICLDCQQALVDASPQSTPSRPSLRGLPGSPGTPSRTFTGTPLRSSSGTPPRGTPEKSLSLASLAGGVYQVDAGHTVNMFNVALIASFIYATPEWLLFALAVTTENEGWKVFSLFGLFTIAFAINIPILHFGRSIPHKEVVNQIYIFEAFVIGFAVFAHIILAIYIFSTSAKEIMFALTITTELISHTLTITAIVHTFQFS